MTEVATNFNINKGGVAAKNMKMAGVQSAEVDAILKTLKDDAIWKSMEKFSCDGKNKVMLGDGGGPTPVVGLPNLLAGVPAAVVAPLPPPELVDPNDPQPIGVAKWAVEENNGQTGNNRTFVKLLRGGLKWKVESGTIYAFLLHNRDDLRLYTSKAAVFEQAGTMSKIAISWAD